MLYEELSFTIRLLPFAQKYTPQIDAACLLIRIIAFVGQRM